MSETDFYGALVGIAIGAALLTVFNRQFTDAADKLYDITKEAIFQLKKWWKK